MKAPWIPLLLALLSASTTWAQHAPPGRPLTPEQRARMEQLRVAFFTEQLELTPDEAKAFWPVFEAHEAAAEAHRVEMQALAQARPTSDQAARDLIAQVAEHRKAEVDLESELLLELLPILGPERTALFPQLGMEFRRSIVEAARQRQGGAPGGPPGRQPRP